MDYMLPYPDLYYPGTSIVWTAQISHVAYSLLTTMKFGLDERELAYKGFCLPGRWLVYSTNNKYITWVLGDKTFLQSRGVPMNALSILTSPSTH